MGVPKKVNMMKYGPAICLVAAVLTTSCDSVDRLPSPIAPKSLNGISLSQTSVMIARNERVQLQATATYSDGSSEDVTASAVWTTTNATVAAVSAGAVTGSGPGKVQVQAAFSGKTASSDVIVRRNVLIASSVTVTCTDPRVTNIAALRAELDDTLIQNLQADSDHAAFRTRTIAFWDIRVPPGDHVLDIDIVKFGWAPLVESRAAAVISTYTAVPAPVQLSDADTRELLFSITLPTQEVEIGERGARLTWQLSIPVFDQ